MGKAYRLVMHELTLRDIMDIRADEKYRLTTSPFGITPEQYERNPPIYVGAAVAWKMHPERMPPAVKAGLEKAIKISKAAAGILGTVIYNGKLYPKKCIEQKRIAKKI